MRLGLLAIDLVTTEGVLRRSREVADAYGGRVECDLRQNGEVGDQKEADTPTVFRYDLMQSDTEGHVDSATFKGIAGHARSEIVREKYPRRSSESPKTATRLTNLHFHRTARAV